MKTKLNIAATIFLLSACSQGEESHGKIYRGQTADADSSVARSTVSIMWKKKNGVTRVACTGTLINDTTVVTAAHCLMNVREPSQLYIGHGTNPEIIGNSKLIAIHPSFTFDPFGLGDIGMIKLQEPVAGDLSADLISTDFAIKNEDPVVIAGYGLTHETTNNYGTLHWTETKILSTDSTTRTFSISKAERKGICDGDSGGPAYFFAENGKPLIGGVASTSDECDEGGGEFVDLRQSIYQDWLANLKNNDTSWPDPVAFVSRNRSACQSSDTGWDFLESPTVFGRGICRPNIVKQNRFA